MSRQPAIHFFLCLSFCMPLHCFGLLAPDPPDIPWILLGALVPRPGQASSPAFLPGLGVDLDGNGSTDATASDSSGDGTADGLDFDGDGIPEIPLVDSNADGAPDALDTNGDGTADYYWCASQKKITTAANCAGSAVAVVAGQGFDTNGDGTAENTILAQIAGDTQAPTLAASLPAGTYNTAQSVTLTCTDNVSPGAIVYTTDGSAPAFSPLVGTYAAPPSVTVTLSSSATLRAICRDAGGRQSATLARAYTIDPNVPVISIQVLSSAYISNSGGIASASLDYASTRAGTRTIYDGASCGAGNNYGSAAIPATTTQNFVFTPATHFAGAGAKTFLVCVLDSTNGLTGFTSVTITRDDTAPGVAIDSPSGAGPHTSGTTFSASCADGGAGCHKIAYTTNGTNPTFDAAGAITNGAQYSGATTIPDGASVDVRVRSRDLAGNVSTVTSQSFAIGPPGTPTGFSAAPAGSGQVNLSWTAVSGATSYRVYRKTSSGVTSADTLAGNPATNSLSDTGLTDGTTYYYKVSAVHAGGESGLSSEVNVIPSTVLRIYVTASTYSGNLGGVAGADAICNADASKPNGSSYKAYVYNQFTLAANQNYFRANGSTLIGTTDASGNMPTTLTNSISTSNLRTWIGDASNNCAAWGGTFSFATRGATNATNSTWQAFDTQSCTGGNNYYLYCVEQ